MLKWSVAAVALLGLTAEAAQAQGPQSPPPPSERLLGGGRNPAVTHLMQAYRISEEVAQDRIEIQNEVVELAKRLNAESDPNYAGIWIEHEPVYRVVVAFADQQDRREFGQASRLACSVTSKSYLWRSPDANRTRILSN